MVFARTPAEGADVRGDADGSIGRRIAAARRRLGWNREALAFHSGVSWSAIAQLEAGRRANARPSTLRALAGALGVTVDYLIGESVETHLLDHRAAIYRSDEEFRRAALASISDAAAASDPVLVVTTRRKLELVRDGLSRTDLDVTFEESTDWYSAPLEAVSAFRSFVTGRIEDGADWVRILAEPVWPTEPGNERLWATYESMFNLIFARMPATVTCAYDEPSVGPGILDIAATTHPRLTSDGGVAENARFIPPEDFLLRGDPRADEGRRA